MRACGGPPSIVIAGLEKIDPILTDDVHQPVLGSDPPGPGAGMEVLEGLRFAESRERLAKDRFDEFERT